MKVETLLAKRPFAQSSIKDAMAVDQNKIIKTENMKLIFKID